MKLNFVFLLISAVLIKTGSVFGMSVGIDLKAGSNPNVNPKDQTTTLPISASIEGNTLTVNFYDDLGEVLVEVTTPEGNTVAGGTHQITPNSAQYVIANSGSYLVTITFRHLLKINLLIMK